MNRAEERLADLTMDDGRRVPTSRAELAPPERWRRYRDGGAVRNRRKVVDMNDGMSIELQFVFYVAAVVCFVLAALGGRVRAQVGFLPLGLALFVFPTMWNTGVAAF